MKKRIVNEDDLMRNHVKLMHQIKVSEHDMMVANLERGARLAADALQAGRFKGTMWAPDLGGKFGNYTHEANLFRVFCLKERYVEHDFELSPAMKESNLQFAALRHGFARTKFVRPVPLVKDWSITLNMERDDRTLGIDRRFQIIFDDKAKLSDFIKRYGLIIYIDNLNKEVNDLRDRLNLLVKTRDRLVSV